MKAVGVIDTSVFLAILRVPGRDERSDEVIDDLEVRTTEGHSLLLPLAAIIETGNHIGRLNDGRERRGTAKRFADVVRAAAAGNAPFTPTQAVQQEDVFKWCDAFVGWVTPRGRELADLSIKQVWERQCELNEARRVYIWSFDDHLISFVREPLI